MIFWTPVLGQRNTAMLENILHDIFLSGLVRVAVLLTHKSFRELLAELGGSNLSFLECRTAVSNCWSASSVTNLHLLSVLIVKLKRSSKSFEITDDKNQMHNINWFCRENISSEQMVLCPVICTHAGCQKRIKIWYPKTWEKWWAHCYMRRWHVC